MLGMRPLHMRRLVAAATVVRPPQRGAEPPAPPSPVPPPTTAAVSSSSSSSLWISRRPLFSAAAPSRALICPECGKRFLRDSILREHRRSRHLVSLPTPQEEADAALEGDIRSLKAQLHAVRGRIEQLRNRSSTGGGGGSGLQPQRGRGTGDDVVPFPAATTHGRILSGVSDDVLRAWGAQDRTRVIGTTLSGWVGVGTVVEHSARLGTLLGWEPQSPCLDGSAPAEASAAPAPVSPRVLQFQMHTRGYRERRPGQLKMFRNTVTVRYLFPESAAAAAGAAPDVFTVRGGDLVRIQGNYAQHKTFDPVSKRFVENVVVEADMIGLLERGPAKTQGGAQPGAHVGGAPVEAAGGREEEATAPHTAATHAPPTLPPGSVDGREEKAAKQSPKAKKRLKRKKRKVSRVVIGK